MPRTKLVSRFLIAIALPGLGCGTGPNPQPRRATDVPDAPSCGSCRIVFTPLFTLRARGLEADVPYVANVRTDAAGRFWMFDGERPPLLFDRLGMFVRTVGKAGDGPGEFRGPTEIVPLPGDSILILDEMARRGTVLDPNLTPVRNVALPPKQILPGVVVLRWPDNVVVHVPQEGMPRELGPLLRLSLEGRQAEVLSSFGSEPDGDTGPDWFVRLYHITPARSGGHWSADYALYQLSRWSADGNRVQVLRRRTEWFPPPPTNPGGGPNRPPSARIASIVEDSTGLLWVFSSIAAPTWREAYAPAPLGQRERDPASVALEKLHTTRVEVLDPVAGRVVARSDPGHLIIGALSEQRVALYTVGRDDQPRVVVARFTLERR